MWMLLRLGGNGAGPKTSHSQQDDVELSTRSLLADRSFVRCCLLRGLTRRGVDSEDLRLGYGARRELVEKLRLEGEVVRVGVVKRNTALISVENTPCTPPHGTSVRLLGQSSPRHLG